MATFAIRIERLFYFTVTLRCRSIAEASKGDGPAAGSAVHPSRLFTRRVATHGSRLRMTGLAASAPSRLRRGLPPHRFSPARRTVRLTPLFLGNFDAREDFQSRLGAGDAGRSPARRGHATCIGREAHRARGRQLRLQEHRAARQSVQGREPDGGDAWPARLHTGRRPRPARSRQGRDGPGGAELWPAGAGRRRRAVLLCRPRRAGLGRQLSRAGRRQSDARGRRRLPDDRCQSRAAPDAGIGHAPQPRDPGRLPQQPLRLTRPARLRWRPRADARPRAR
jgi:hypothetical protein